MYATVLLSLIEHRLLSGSSGSASGATGESAPNNQDIMTAKHRDASLSATRGMIFTLIINIGLFLVFVFVFESNRLYKQIFLKRYQKRFVETSRVPEEPPSHIFGWLVSIFRVEEVDVLQMVGLDAYMLLRYHVLCFKLCCFLTFWGLLVLLPSYGTVASPLSNWERYSLLNVVSGLDRAHRDRIWLAAIFGYIFAAYFCHLLYLEYQMFSNNRLNALMANHDGQVNDTTDNLPQKYYTIMLEKIPAELRSAQKLAEHFEELFPGDVYHVEVSLDLRELNAYISKRKAARNHLEKAIARYAATGQRPLVYVKTSPFLMFPEGIRRALQLMPQSKESCCECLENVLKYERYGYENVDAIDHYTAKLLELNIYEKCFELSRLVNSKDMQRKIKNRYDTRAAAAVESLNARGNEMMRLVSQGRIEKIFSKDDKAVSGSYGDLESLSNPAGSPVTPSFKSQVTAQERGTGTGSREGGEEEEEEEVEDILMKYAREDSLRDNAKTTREAATNGLIITADSEAASMGSNPEEEGEESRCSGKNNLTRKTRIKTTPDSSASIVKDSKKGKAMLAQKSRYRRGSQKLFKSKAFRNAEAVGKQGWNQTQIAGIGALRGVLEMERAFEMITIGAFYKFSSTAFVTFKSRMAETIAHQMLLSHQDNMEINHAPNPHDIIWENVAIPKSQVLMRTFITNVGLVVGSIFWSSLVTSINGFAKTLSLPEMQQNFLSVVIILGFLMVLPFIFDSLARYYEGMKLESEIQNSIMTRYFYYQMVNIYVTVGLDGVNFIDQLAATFRDPQTAVNILGKTVPSLSLYFCNLIIVKIFAAIPLEMLRPWQLSSILLLGTCMDRKKCTRRELRTGAFYAWPMLYGWIYPQLMMVQMIMVTYACIAPLLMPFGALFFVVSYAMYKYQLLYVYVNDNQSLGYMWYAVVNRSLLALLFASLTLLSFFCVYGDDLGAFFFTLPLPAGILYFWHYVDESFRKTSMDLSFSSAKKLDNRNDLRKEAKRPVPQDSFKKDLYRQPTLTEHLQYPEPYRKYGDYESSILSPPVAAHGRGGGGGLAINPSSMARRMSLGLPFAPVAPVAPQGDNRDLEVGVVYEHEEPLAAATRLRASSINVHALEDEREETESMLKAYFSETVLKGLCNPQNIPRYRELARLELYGQQQQQQLQEERAVSPGVNAASILTSISVTSTLPHYAAVENPLLAGQGITSIGDDDADGVIYNNNNNNNNNNADNRTNGDDDGLYGDDIGYVCGNDNDNGYGYGHIADVTVVEEDGMEEERFDGSPRYYDNINNSNNEDEDEIPIGATHNDSPLRLSGRGMESIRMKMFDKDAEV